MIQQRDLLDSWERLTMCDDFRKALTEAEFKLLLC